MEKATLYDFNKEDILTALREYAKKKGVSIGPGAWTMTTLESNAVRGVAPPKKVFSGIRIKIDG